MNNYNNFIYNKIIHHNFYIMKYSIFFMVIILSYFNSTAQNVGIGTVSPTEKLEVNNPLRSTLKISSASYNDTTQLIFSNRTSTGQGTDFLISSKQEQGLLFTSSSDLSTNNNDSSLIIKPNGNIGIGVISPTAKLDINGLINARSGVYSSAPVRLSGTNYLELGAGVAGKEPNAGKIGYKSFSANSLDIVGAGAGTTDRKVYFFAEGGTYFNGPINAGSSIQINGNAGSAGQVLTSNGAAPPSWKSSSFNNSTRFSVDFIRNSSSTSLADFDNINYTRYNLNTSDITIGTSNITINRSGLYHFDIDVHGSISYPSAPIATPHMEYELFVGAPNGYKMIDNTAMNSDINTNLNWSADRKSTLDVYITAPASLELYHVFNVGGGVTYSSYNVFGYLNGYLISE